MRAGGSKAKGSAFEREVCRLLSEWLSFRERDDLFWRSSMSGGRATVQFKRGKTNLTQSGDISAIDPLGSKLTDVFFIECKHVKSLKMEGLYLGYETGIADYWKVCCREAKRYNKLPMLIAKENRYAAVVCLDIRGMASLRLGCGVQGTRAFLICPGVGVHVLSLTTFLRRAARP